jgi:hypothetical protein
MPSRHASSSMVLISSMPALGQKVIKSQNGDESSQSANKGLLGEDRLGKAWTISLFT